MEIRYGIYNLFCVVLEICFICRCVKENGKIKFRFMLNFL